MYLNFDRTEVRALGSGIITKTVSFKRAPYKICRDYRQLNMQRILEEGQIPFRKLCHCKGSRKT